MKKKKKESPLGLVPNSCVCRRTGERGGLGLEESGAAPFGSHRRDKEGNSLVQSTLVDSTRASRVLWTQSATSPERVGDGWNRP